MILTNTLMNKAALLLLTLTLSWSTQGQQGISGSFSSNGQTRSYAGAIPNNPQSSLRLVILFCGAGEDTTDMINRGYENHLGNNSMVVYPQPTDPAGFDNDASVDDFQMVEDLITEISGNYNINVNDICIGGFSNGAIFSYKLVCDFNATGSSRTYSFKSFAIVSGAMEDGNNNLTSCPVASEVPLIAFHGAQDPIINVNGGFLFPPVNIFYEALDSTLAFWAEDVNGCAPNPAVTPLPDVVNEIPNSSVQRFDYTCSSSPNTTFYYVIGGFHSWPGGNASIDTAQAANRDINASQLIADFFNSSPTVSISEENLNSSSIKVYPNPATDFFTIESAYDLNKVEILNINGVRVLSRETPVSSIAIGHLEPGIYFVKIETEAGTDIKKIMKS